MKKSLILLCCAAALGAHGQKFENLAPTPPMGWNSWNKFGCDVREELIKQIADVMVSSGLKDAGYQYINIDDCWQGERDAQGFIRPDAKRFPSGMKALGDYLHSKGLKFGIYSDAGWKTCGGKPGSRGREFQDAQTYASWGVDYLKYDWCDAEALNAEGAYLTMRDALYAAGRPMVFSICEWGNQKPWLWGAKMGHLWRTTGDIVAMFEGTVDHGSWKSSGILQILDMQQGLRQYAGPGHWNDPDMLEVGNGMTVNEDRANFSMWCMLAAPLIAGNDLRNMTAETLEILANKDAIAVDQDPLGIQGFRFSTDGVLEIWFKPLTNEAWAMCVLNRSPRDQKVLFEWKTKTVVDELSKRDASFATTTYGVRDVWTRKNLGTTQQALNADAPAHDVVFLLLQKQ